MNVVAGQNELKLLTTPHVKIHLNAENNAFTKAARKVVLGHNEEVSLNQFSQFTHNSATLLNKDKHHDFGMQFIDAKCRHNNTVALSFRKPLTRKADKVAELVQESCLE